VFDHVDGERRLEAISGNAPYETSKKMFTNALSKIISEKQEWGKHFLDIEIKKKQKTKKDALCHMQTCFLKNQI